MIKCLLNRAWRICSDLKLFDLEVLKAKIILRKNDYPNKVIDKEIERFINNKYEEVRIKEKEDKKIAKTPNGLHSVGRHVAAITTTTITKIIF